METSSNTGVITREIILRNQKGLHLRIAGQIAIIAMRYSTTDIKIWRGQRSANARSALALLTLEAPCGCELRIQAEGDRAEEAVAELSKFIEDLSGSIV